MKIIVTKRSADIHACLEGHPEIWGCGKTQYEAVGNLISRHQSVFNIAIEFAGIEVPRN